MSEEIDLDFKPISVFEAILFLVAGVLFVVFMAGATTLPKDVVFGGAHYTSYYEFPTWRCFKENESFNGAVNCFRLSEEICLLEHTERECFDLMV